MNEQTQQSLALLAEESALSSKNEDGLPINQSINDLLPYKIYNSPTDSFDAETIFYISDLHILHNIDCSSNITRQIRNIAKRLHDQVQREEKSYNYKILFAGDISSDTNITKQFYHYSPIPGIIKEYQSFDEFIRYYINSTQSIYLADLQRKELEAAWENSKASHSLLSSFGSGQRLLIGNSFSERQYANIGLGGIYSASRKMKSLQRLFESNVLREWDDTIFEDIARKGEIEDISMG